MLPGIRNRINPGRLKALKTLLLVMAVAALIFMVSCAHHPEAEGDGKQRVNRVADPRHDPAAPEIQKQLEAEYRRWRGTRHRLGGNSRNGIDCSGFVKAVYKNIFDMDLPRTTKAQATLGRPVKKTDLKAGDLVFFKPPTYPRHVGIYLSNSEFVHASKTKGVTISRMDPYYWDKYFWTARRLLAK
jgi:cell wall-associated NlpC family hydrolase